MIGLYDVAAEDFQTKYVILFVYHTVLQDSSVGRRVENHK